MKKRIMLMVLCGTLLLGTGWVAIAAPGAGRNMGDGPMKNKGKSCRMNDRQDHWVRLTEKLDLSQAQQQEVQKLVEANRELAKGQYQQMIEIRGQMRKAMQPKTFNEKTLRKLAAEKGKIQTELMAGKAGTHSKIYALLTPEQQELADLACKLRRLQGHGSKGERRCPNPMGPQGPQRGKR